MVTTPSNFQFSDSQGATASERYLTRLCSNAFLRLWTYPNLYTDEGITKNGIGKELADVTILFGDNVIIFSDKEARFDADREPKIAWGRWYRKAVEKSVRQLHGAMAWLRDHPDRVFVEKECLHRPSLNIPRGESVRFHLIATTRGTAPFIRALADHEKIRKPIASLSIDTSIIGKAHLDAPLRLGRVSDKHFVHVFDEAALSLVLSVFDTAVDFIDYLTERAKLLSSGQTRLVCAGEEELVALYLSTMVEDESRHGFPDEFYPDGEGVIFLPQDHFDAFIKRPEVARKIEADQSSYVIDKLIDRFVEIGDPTIVGADTSPEEIEIAIRQLASESRFGRRVLAECIRSMVELARSDPARARRARTFPSMSSGDTTLVVLMAEVPEGMSYDDYRRIRSHLLSNYLYCARLATPTRSRYLGLAFDHPNSVRPGGSEDLALFVWPEYSPENETEIRGLADELEIYSPRTVQTHYSAMEFPDETEQTRVSPRSPANKGDKKKRRRKAERKSRKKNRKAT